MFPLYSRSGNIGRISIADEPQCQVPIFRTPSAQALHCLQDFPLPVLGSAGEELIQFVEELWYLVATQLKPAVEIDSIEHRCRPLMLSPLDPDQLNIKAPRKRDAGRSRSACLLRPASARGPVRECLSSEQRQLRILVDGFRWCRCGRLNLVWPR